MTIHPPAAIAAIAADAFRSQEVEDLRMDMKTMPPVESPVVHRFVPGIYIREITMRPGSLIISKIHKHEHPYVISKGRCEVFTREAGWVELKAPFTGITMPGTERVLLIHEETIWTTFHPIPFDVKGEEDLPKIEDHVIAKSHEDLAAFLHNNSKKELT
jgi:hypothetical protein